MKRGHTEEQSDSDSSNKKVRTDDKQLVRPSEVPEYLRGTEFYRSLDTEDDEAFYVPVRHMKANTDVRNLDDACDLLNSARFWGLSHNVISKSIVQFAQTQSFATVESTLSDFEDEISFVKPLLQFINVDNHPSERMEAAMELGIRELVELLDRSGRAVYTEKAIATAASLGHIDCLQYGWTKLQQRVHSYRISDRFCEGAIIKGQLECVKTLFPIPKYWYLKKACLHPGTARCHSKLMHAAALHGQLECLQYLHSAGYYSLNGCAAPAAASGRLDCLKYVVERRIQHYKDNNFNPEVCAAAAEYGHLHCLMYLRDQGCPWDYNVCIGAASAGSLPCLKYYLQNGGEWHYLAIHAAALQYAREHGCPWVCSSTSSKRSKEYQRRFNVVRGEPHLVEQVAQRKHWGCVLYLILQNYPLMTALTTQLARKHKDNLLQLAVERGCPIAKEVGVLYAKAGNLEGLTYVLERGCEPSEQILCAAARRGHLQCLVYAHEQDCPWSKEVCVAAARGGHLECLKYAYEHGCPWDGKVRAVAVKMKHESIVEYVLEKGLSC